MKHKILGPRILLELDRLPETHEPGGKIVRLETTLEQDSRARTKARVKALGPQAYEGETPWCKEGDLVHFNRYGAIVLEHKKEDIKEYWVIRDIDVLTVETE